VRGFREILDGKHDDLPEQAFLLVGTIDDVRAKPKNWPRAGKPVSSIRCQVSGKTLTPDT
jgi:hypothetical protein